MSERQDVFLSGGIHCKHKPMPNGEIRSSMTSPDGTKMGLTKTSSWEPGEALPWQPAHLHKGLIESYQLVSGWMRMVWLDGSVCQTHLTEPGQMRVLTAGVPHIVLLGPGTQIINTSFGASVPNPDKKGNDWWDVEPEFHERIAKEFSIIEEMVLRSF